MTPSRERSSLPEVRNPVLDLPSMHRLQALSPDIRQLLYELLIDLSCEAKAKADQGLKRSKWWTAVYWHCIKVYSQHIARAIRRGRPE